jgi:hypothetical protein
MPWGSDVCANTLPGASGRLAEAEQDQHTSQAIRLLVDQLPAVPVVLVPGDDADVRTAALVLGDKAKEDRRASQVGAPPPQAPAPVPARRRASHPHRGRVGGAVQRPRSGVQVDSLIEHVVFNLHVCGGLVVRPKSQARCMHLMGGAGDRGRRVGERGGSLRVRVKGRDERRDQEGTEA